MIGMRWPRETIDAAMLASAIRIDRAIEMNIRRLVKRDDGPRRLFGQRCFQPPGIVFDGAPAIIQSFSCFAFIAPSLV